MVRGLDGPSARCGASDKKWRVATYDPDEYPEPLVIPGAPDRIRAGLAASGGRIAVLDDDPTGSQTVHGVSIVTVFEDGEYAAALQQAGSTAFILTNSRSLDEPDAVRLTNDVGTSLYRLAAEGDYPVEVVSRSDSTLRGHVWSEVQALNAARREVSGRGYDGVLFAPAYFDAGRFTAGDVHWARVGEDIVPVGETEFSRDATFGYASSDLRDFLAEKSGSGSADRVVSISLHDIRVGGPDRVAEILGRVSDGNFVVVNGTEYADYEVVVLGLQQAQAAGKVFGYRTGPSFVRALAGIDPLPPLTGADIWPAGHAAGHGLVVVGSHVGLTSRQVAAAQRRGGVAEVELDVPTLVDPATRGAHLAEVSARVKSLLAQAHVLLYTSRTLVRSEDPDESLAIARTVSTAVIEVVREAMTARPAWVVAKGGITSHDVLVRGLGVRRATVLGQLFDGFVSVLRPVQADALAVDVPYVVFAGNVGNEDTLAEVIDNFSGRDPAGSR